MWWLAISFACDVPPYELWRSPEKGTWPYVTANASTVAVDLLSNEQGGWTIGQSNLQPTLWHEDAEFFRAQDLGGNWGSRITCSPHREDSTRDTVDCETKEIILVGDRGTAVPDINGDGLRDLHGWSAFYYVSDGDDWLQRATPFPALGPGEDAYSEPVGDVTGDGLGDLVVRVRGGLQGSDLTTGAVHLHVGTPDGYAPEPRWSLPLEAPVIDVISLQMDDDPELELMVLGGDDISGIYPNSTVFWKVDDVASDAVAERLYVTTDNSNGNQVPAIAAAGDMDGDGLGDVAFFSSFSGVCDVGSVGRVLASSRAWDPERPIFVLPIYREPEDVAAGRRAEGYTTGTTVGDFNDDGRIDIATVYHQYLPERVSFIQLWYPGLDETPDRTTPQTTGTTAHTGASNPTTEPETSPRRRNPPAAGSVGGCGCAAPSTDTTTHPLTTWLVRRRSTRGTR